MPKRRASGEGTINQLPSGSWQAQVTLQGRRMTHTSRSQQGAVDWIHEIRDQIEQGLTYDAERTRVGEFLRGWLENKRSRIRTATYEQYVWISTVYLLPEFEKIKLKDLTPGRIQKYYDRLVQSGKGARTIQLAHVVLHGCLEHATKLGIIARNPTSACIVPKASRAEMKFWTEDQVAQFLAGIHGERNEILYHLVLATGMRRGELLGLQWKDVDWLAGTITIRRQAFMPDGGGFVFQEPKTKASLRTVQLGAGTIKRLREQMANADLVRKMARNKWRENDLVFPSMIGTPQSGTSITHEFHKLVIRSGLPVIRFHDCRHTAATIMLNHGIPPTIVAGMLGHSLSVLMTCYAHFIPSMQGEAAQLMDEITTVIKLDMRRS